METASFRCLTTVLRLLQGHTRLHPARHQQPVKIMLSCSGLKTKRDRKLVLSAILIGPGSARPVIGLGNNELQSSGKLRAVVAKGLDGRSIRPTTNSRAAENLEASEDKAYQIVYSKRHSTKFIRLGT